MTSSIKLDFRFEGKLQRLMRSRGVDGNCFAGAKNAFEFDISAVKIKPDIPNVINKGIPIKRQIRDLERIMDNPFKGAPIIGIGSFPTDLRAKLIACNIMAEAIKLQVDGSNPNHATKDLPYWHKVFGGYNDKIRDAGLPDNPSMLIISNIDVDSTPMKVEKVRDILEKFTRIPRIVVVSGTDPMGFFANKLHLTMDYGFYVGSDNRENKQDVVLDL